MDRLIAEAKLRQQKLERLAIERQQEELAQCTFKPDRSQSAANEARFLSNRSSSNRSSTDFAQLEAAVMSGAI